MAVAPRVATTAAVTQADVQVAVRTEDDLSAIMVGEWLRHLHDNGLAVPVRYVGIILVDGETRH